MSKKRLRIFAGPNGSGKTTLKTTLEEQKIFHFHEYLNADDILKQITDTGRYPLLKDEIFEDLKHFAEHSSYGQSVKSYFLNGDIVCAQNCLFFEGSALNAYTVSLLVSYRCNVFIRTGVSFSFETVFSDEHKLDLIEEAKRNGFKVYLYAIATEQPEINRDRIENRVADGGHAVSYEKVLKRYPKSLSNISKSINIVDEAYFWDNSSRDTRFIASYDASDLRMEIKVSKDVIPRWFDSFIIKKL